MNIGWMDGKWWIVDGCIMSISKVYLWWMNDQMVGGRFMVECMVDGQWMVDGFIGDGDVGR